jgi:hypothetical protein
MCESKQIRGVGEKSIDTGYQRETKMAAVYVGMQYQLC